MAFLFRSLVQVQFSAIFRFILRCGLIVFFILSVFGIEPILAQQDSTSLSIETGTIVSSQEVLPLYLHSNIGGFLDYNFNGTYLKGTLDIPLITGTNSKLDMGLSLVALKQSPIINFQQVFMEYDFGRIIILAGKKEKTESPIEKLSMGSFGISNNARPIPKIGVFVNDFWHLPFLKGFVSLKGSLMHGWMEEGRYINRPWLHGKTAYLKLGNGKVTLIGGLNHYAIWAGISSQTGERLDHGLDDFWRVFRGKGLPEIEGGEGNALGSSLGFWEFILKLRIGSTDLELGNKNPFEDGGGSKLWSFKKDKDRILSIRLDFKKNSVLIIDKVVMEYMSTTFQQGPGLPDEIPLGVNNFGYSFGGRDDTYNNFLYRDGWTYNDRVIGNPLFIDRALSSFYFDNLNDYEVAIVNNRIRSFHFGFSGSVNSTEFKVKGTISKNYGTYSGLYDGRFNWGGIKTDPNFDYPFKYGLRQTYLLLELKNKPFKRDRNIGITLKLALDKGQIIDNFGAFFSISYSNL